jgi:hypothetical protein
MWFTFRHTIRGWFTDIRWWHGRDGIRTLESGLAGRIFHSDLGSESGGGAGLDGDGVTGDSTGMTITRGSTAGGTTPGAERFITGAPTLVADLHEAAVLTEPAAASTEPEGPDLSMETGRRLEDMQHRAVRAGCDLGPSAATTMEGRPGTSHRAEAPASVGDFMAAEGSTEAEAAGDGNRIRDGFPVVRRL